MRLKRALQEVRTIAIPARPIPVEVTVAEDLESFLERRAMVHCVADTDLRPAPGRLVIAAAGPACREFLRSSGVPLPDQGDWIYFDADELGGGLLTASSPHFLYGLFTIVTEDLQDQPLEAVRGWLRPVSFQAQRSGFDLFLNQYGRVIAPLNKDRYLREYARLGFTHVEVNGLATPFPIEDGVPGEFYRDFYTYCPGLDQFIESRLNRGTYPAEYLQANLNNLKNSAQLAVRYGLAPGLVCFEPRSVPETLLQRYPQLRGPRVDHPFRSFRPRFSLSLAHPLARRHYAELMANLLAEVPALSFLAVWSNDSGSGFEHTQSLYVGRNGGAYLIREWKNQEEIARSAAGNIIRFYRLLRDAAARINPRFRVITRLESFYGEHDFLWEGLGDGVDAEVNSLRARGWENNYRHPHYEDVSVLGSAWHQTLDEREAGPIAELRSRGGEGWYFHFFNSHGNHEPLTGIPFAGLAWEKLASMRSVGVSHICHMGGLNPPEEVPVSVNQEIFRAFQFNLAESADQAVSNLAARHMDPANVADLNRAWQLLDQAVRYFMPLPLYTGFGAVWLRLLVRPLVPDIEAIPAGDRAYYEKFMVGAGHNPNIVDLARDVLFELVPVDYARRAVERIDARSLPPLQEAMELLDRKAAEARRRGNKQAFALLLDQAHRSRALKCLFETQRNTAAWVYGVHTWLRCDQPEVKEEMRRLLAEMVRREIANARDLLALWNASPVRFMAVSALGETPFIHGANFPELLRRKIDLMERYGDRDPHIDPDFMWRVPNNPYEDEQYTL
jgi:hypothetical protein